MPILPLIASAVLAAGGTCPGAIPNDGKPDHAALQACLDKGGRVALEPGDYVIAATVYLTKNGTELTSADAANKARLVADLDLYDYILRASRPENYAITHLVFDGRIHERKKASKCKGYRGGGTNLFTQGKNYQLLDIESTGALCGSAMQVEGEGYEIAGCRVHDNGSTQALS
ncbi:MAG: hypothetical protein HY925_06405, partial [Elusimicrobia bacterium]|nr:hypothetical protein [Elusimicrobiota bacterium]